MAQVLRATASSMAVFQCGKWPMPNPSNQAPAANTVTKNPIEPHSRTRPYKRPSKTPPRVTRCAMADSFIGIMALVCKNITNSTRATQATPAVLAGSHGLNHRPNDNTRALVAAKRSNLTRSPVWSLNQPQPYGAASRVADCTEINRLMFNSERPFSCSHSGKYGLKKPMCAK